MISCSGSKKMMGTRGIQTFISIDSLFNQIYEQQSYQSYLAKGTIAYSGSDFEGEADAQLFVLKDSFAICIIKKLGIELARMYIDKDSICFLDRIEKTWFRRSIQNWVESVSLPVDYFLIQDILTTGFYLTDYLSYDWQQVKDSSVLLGISELFEMSFNIGFNPINCKSITFKSLGNQAEFNIEKSTIINSKAIPSSIDIYLLNELKNEKFLRIKWKEIQLNNSERLKFDIPSRYTRRT